MSNTEPEEIKNSPHFEEANLIGSEEEQGEVVTPQEPQMEDNLLDENQEKEGFTANKDEAPATQFQDVVFPKLCDVVDQMRQGNFMPICLMRKMNPEMDFYKTDSSGYNVIHYSVCFGNLQTMKIFYEEDPACLLTLSSQDQTPLMVACSFNNLPVLKFVSDKISTFDHVDKFGFTAITYCVKNNFLPGLFLLLEKGMSLEEDIVDTNRCNILHWASFMDRKLITQILFRLGFDFLREDDMNMTPWDRAIDNWSLFSINFMLDYTNRPLKTNYFLNGSTRLTELDLIPESPQKRLYEIESEYIPYKLVEISKRRKQLYESIWGVFKDNYCLDIKNWVKTNWDKYNIEKKYWLRTYFVIFSLLLVHFFLITKDVFEVSSLSKIVVFVITLFFSFKFGNTNNIAQHMNDYRGGGNNNTSFDRIEMTTRETKGLNSNLSGLDLDNYYVTRQDYEDYLNMYNLNDPINRGIVEDIKNEDWEVFDKLNDADYCGCCLIAKPTQTRHCPMVGLCVPKYQKYSYFFDKPIYFANEFIFFMMLTFEVLSLYLYNLQFYNIVGDEILQQRSIVVRCPWMIYNLVLLGNYFNIFIYIITTYAFLIKMFHFCVFCYSVSKNLTLDEIYNPHYYPYLFRESKHIERKWVFFNPSDNGFVRNWGAFIKQGFSKKILNPDNF